MKKNKWIMFLALVVLVSSSIYAFNSKQTDGLSSFIGTWQYKASGYTFTIEIKSITNSTLDAVYSVAAQNGSRLDIPEEGDSNVEFVSYTNQSNTLRVKLKSSYSTAIHNVSLRLLSSTSIEYELGAVVRDDEFLYPYKNTVLTKKQ